MKSQRISHAEYLMMTPWWVSVVVCVVGNVLIWMIVPEYLEANRPVGITNSMLTGGYAGAQPMLSKLFNLAMAIVVVFSLFNNFVLKERRGF